jgi:hypothetical protein
MDDESTWIDDFNDGSGKRLTDDQEKVIVKRFAAAQQEIVLQSADLSLKTVANMVETGAIDIAPVFQRRERWSPSKQSLLIESFVLNLPVPPIYLAEDELGTYAVIDGKQRVTAIANYLSGRLALNGLDRFPQLDGLRFGELPRQLRNSLELRPLRSVSLLRPSNEDLKYEVFHRLNRYGEILNAQEIRNVIYRGPLNQLVYKLAEDPFLSSQLKIEPGKKSSAYHEMLDAEYVVRFLTLRGSWSDFSGALGLSMDNFMKRNRIAPEVDLRELEAAFSRALHGCESVWGSRAFRRPGRDQMLAGMYDAQMIVVDGLDDDQISALVAKGAQAIRVVTDLFQDPDFEQAVRTGTNTPARVRYRITVLGEAVRALLV